MERRETEQVDNPRNLFQDPTDIKPKGGLQQLTPYDTHQNQAADPERGSVQLEARCTYVYLCIELGRLATAAGTEE